MRVTFALQDGLRIRTLPVSPLHIQLYLLREYTPYSYNKVLIKARGQRAAEEVAWSVCLSVSQSVGRLLIGHSNYNRSVGLSAEEERDPLVMCEIRCAGWRVMSILTMHQQVNMGSTHSASVEYKILQLSPPPSTSDQLISFIWIHYHRVHRRRHVQRLKFISQLWKLWLSVLQWLCCDHSWLDWLAD